MPSNTSQANPLAQGSGAPPTQGSTLSEDRKTPSLPSRVSNGSTESHQARKMSGKAQSYAMQRWLQEKPEEQPWSASAGPEGDLANQGAQDAKKVDGPSSQKE